MDDDNEKSVIEKMVDKVNDAVANIINTASTPAMRAGARSRSSRSDDQRASLHSGNDRRDDRAWFAEDGRKGSRAQKISEEIHEKRTKLRRLPQKHRRRLR